MNRFAARCCSSRNALRISSLLPAAFLMVILLSGCMTAHRKLVQAYIEQLCAQDGGISVYETVPLPPGKRLFAIGAPDPHRSVRGLPFARTYGFISRDVFNPALGREALGPEYIWSHSNLLLQGKEPGGPKLWRLHYLIARKADGKILGELVSYQRVNDNDVLPLDQLFFGGTYVDGCPARLGPESLIGMVFVETVEPKK